MAAELPEGSLLLNCPVTRIQQNDHEVVVESIHERFKCQRAIVSVPTPLYKEISFSPPLRPNKLKLSQSTKLGCYGKSICVYKQPWWREAGFCGLLQSGVGPAGVFRDTSVDDLGQYSITCFMVGKPAREWGELSRQERDEAVLGQIEAGFGRHAIAAGITVDQPAEIVEQQWLLEKWSQGCPCPAMPPGVMSELGHELRMPAGRLHFVGTETAYEWKGYMDGAVRSGERGAKEVLEMLNR